ncbi:1,2-phenylacetyl-CoA epoxidase subunit PaaC [Actinomadura sp. WMMB 499]|uniref:1,2-phenylacetyl-CoA epoxidase subunit PaaC n=1 Tax=Actinomadura sp. WMMB 499 TaxID=1219491 RepID=UPI00124937C0|nr:1,2-phenylacetyl-CoA epoxidase subunit PaaC [Actinomadura sp. WMMB 499]QFG20147.1 phenylacetate-CoA oxygenase subunit PaaC [Actinomadura sp. WMMB 499]
MTNDDHGSVFDGLVEGAGDASRWAFGTGFEDPLAGVDTAPPAGADPAALAAYCLMLGDDALIMSQRLAEWCSRAPDLEDDIALANMALDLLGQARLLLSRAAAADPAAVPALPAGSPVPPEDALAFFRDAGAFRNVRLAEVANGDFAHVVVRLLLLSTVRLALLDRLRASRDGVLAAVAAKGVKEVAYHRDWAGRWFLVLARGTAESRRRLVAALDALWPLLPELLAPHPVEVSLADIGVGVDPASLSAEVDAVLARVLEVSGVQRPAGVSPEARGTGRDGDHTAAFGPLLAEMQEVARAHPAGLW